MDIIKLSTLIPEKLRTQYCICLITNKVHIINDTDHVCNLILHSNIKLEDIHITDIHGSIVHIELDYLYIDTLRLINVQTDSTLVYTNSYIHTLILRDTFNLCSINTRSVICNISCDYKSTINSYHSTSYKSASLPLSLMSYSDHPVIGYKTLRGDRIAVLKILSEWLIDKSSLKCRCNKVKVLNIIKVGTKESFEIGQSIHDNKFLYKVGEIIDLSSTKLDVTKVCGEGIHFFLTLQQAIDYI